jgi:hypothetical protein
MLWKPTTSWKRHPAWRLTSRTSAHAPGHHRGKVGARERGRSAPRQGDGRAVRRPKELRPPPGSSAAPKLRVLAEDDLLQQDHVEASRYLAGIETDISRGQWTDPRAESVLLRDYCHDGLQQRTVRGRPLAPRTTDTYRHSLDAWVLPILGDVPIDRVTPAHIRGWHAQVSATTRPTAVRQAYAVRRAVLNTAVADDLLQRNPCRIKGAGQAYSQNVRCSTWRTWTP